MLLAGSWYDQLNPFHYLAGAAGKVVADGWTAAMLGLWNAGLWAMRLVLNIMDAFLTPDLSENGPGAQIYAATFWIAGALVLVMVMIQLGVAAIRRDGKSLATLLVGGAQFTIVWAAWVAYGVAVIAACGGLTRALMGSLLKVSSWSAWQPWTPFTTADIVDGTVATVLGLMGLLLWLAAIGHLLVMLTRGGALMVLSATTPISAAGLVSDAGRSWFWKSLRWFHAAAFTPVLMVLVLGIGIQMTTGVANGLADKTQAAIGTALPGVILILISCFAPLALFKLLAFVDPGTSSGAAVRQGLAAQGGLQGLLGGISGSPESSGAAASTDANGRFTKLDPYAGAQLALAEAYRNVAATGAKPLAVTNCLNFGSPEDPAVMWQFAEAVRGLADACEALDVPVTGGNVSFYNQTGEVAILPTPVVGVLGVIDDVARRTPMALGPEGESVLLVGETRDELGGSEWAHVVHGHLGGLPPTVDLQRERQLAEILVAGSRDGMLTAAHDVSEGGVALALVEMALRGGRGARVVLPDDVDPFVALFSESTGRAVVVVPRSEELRFTDMCVARHVPVARVGVVDGVGDQAELAVQGQFSVSLAQLRTASEATLPALFGPSVG